MPKNTYSRIFQYNFEIIVILTPAHCFMAWVFYGQVNCWLTSDWINRVQPHLEEHIGLGTDDLQEKLTTDAVSALYSVYQSAT